MPFIAPALWLLTGGWAAWNANDVIDSVTAPEKNAQASPLGGISVIQVGMWLLVALVVLVILKNIKGLLKG